MGGEYYDEHKAVSDILKQLPKALIIMVIILVAMFNAFKQPVIILSTIPLAATGATFALLAFDKPFGFMALIGAITLMGMIIKNGIVLMDQIELERKNGMDLSDAIKSATINRTMAISMGALTTALGMIPLLSDLLFDQMAATIIGVLLLQQCCHYLLCRLFIDWLIKRNLQQINYQHKKYLPPHNKRHKA